MFEIKHPSVSDPRETSLSDKIDFSVSGKEVAI
jgi:hypothetical protein